MFYKEKLINKSIFAREELCNALEKLLERKGFEIIFKNTKKRVYTRGEQERIYINKGDERIKFEKITPELYRYVERIILKNSRGLFF